MRVRYDDALEKAEMLIKEFPDEVLYNGLLAEIYVAKGEREKARQVYTDLLERNPDDPRIQLAVCEFLIDEKDYKELFLLMNNVILNANIKREDKISLFARMIELPDLISRNSDELIIALMVFEANYKNDDIVPLFRPEVMIKMAKLDEAALRLEEIIKKILIIIMHGKSYYWYLIKKRITKIWKSKEKSVLRVLTDHSLQRYFMQMVHLRTRTLMLPSRN